MTADPAPAVPAPESDELTTDLIAFIQDDVAIATGDIDADTDLLLGGFVDSLGVVVIVGWLETRLDIRIDPADVVLENFLTVGDMVRYVRSR